MKDLDKDNRNEIFFIMNQMGIFKAKKQCCKTEILSVKVKKKFKHVFKVQTC